MTSKRSSQGSLFRWARESPSESSQKLVKFVSFVGQENPRQDPVKSWSNMYRWLGKRIPVRIQSKAGQICIVGWARESPSGSSQKLVKFVPKSGGNSYRCPVLLSAFELVSKISVQMYPFCSRIISPAAAVPALLCFSLGCADEGVRRAGDFEKSEVLRFLVPGAEFVAGRAWYIPA